MQLKCSTSSGTDTRFHSDVRRHVETLLETHLLGSASNRILRYIHVSWSSPSELDTLWSQNCDRAFWFMACSKASDRPISSPSVATCSSAVYLSAGRGKGEKGVWGEGGGGGCVGRAVKGGVHDTPHRLLCTRVSSYVPGHHIRGDICVPQGA